MTETIVTIAFPDSESAQGFMRWIAQNRAAWVAIVDEDFYYSYIPVVRGMGISFVEEPLADDDTEDGA